MSTDTTPADRTPAIFQPDAALGQHITRASSTQTYYTIRLLADRDRADDAFCAYAYFRWVDDRLDDAATAAAARAVFLARQQALLAAATAGRALPGDLAPEETLLAGLVAADNEPDSGLRSYLHHMMAVMAFDVARRGRAISAVELAEYSRLLATAVGDALFHFIGHDCQPPREPARYAAIRGAHIIHMLRDAAEDAALGYANVPAEFLAVNGLLTANGLATADLGEALFDLPAFREWVAERVRLARRDFAIGRRLIERLACGRCRLAGYAYIARFEWLAERIAHDGYRLRVAYPERKSRAAALWMARRTAPGLARPRRVDQEALRPARER